MKNLFEAAAVAEVKGRLGRLRPDSARQWGKMDAAQAVAHCAASMEWVVGDSVPPPGPWAARIIGRIIKPLALGNEKPLRRNSPTAQTLVVADARDLDWEREKLRGLIDRFVCGGPAACTRHPHSFFGRMTPQEWATLMYKHLDHHLRQFGA